MATLAALTSQDAGKTDGISFYLFCRAIKKSRKTMNTFTLNIRKEGYENIPWMLFNLKEDRNESKDLSALHPDLLQHFNKIVQKEHRHPHIKEWEIIDQSFKMEFKKRFNFAIRLSYSSKSKNV